MTAYDAAMIGVVVLGMIWGAWRGLTWQVAGLASLIVGFLVARTGSEALAPHFPGTPIVARALAMLAIYVAVSGGIFAVAWTIRATLKRLKFEAYDRHLGMVFGGLEGAVLGVVGTLFVVSLAPTTRGPIFASPSGRLVGQVMDSVGTALPAEVRDVLAPFWDGTAAGPPARSQILAGSDVEEKPLGVDGLIEPFRDELDSLRQSAGKAVGSAIEDGQPGALRGLIDEGRQRLGRAAGKALDDPNLTRTLGRSYEPDAPAPRRR